MMVSKYDLYAVYNGILTGCTKQGIDLGSIVLSKENRNTALNTREMDDIIDDVVNSTIGPVGPGGGSVGKSDSESLLLLRMLNDGVRYNLDGKFRVVSLMLNEWLPKRPDYRSSPRPQMNPQCTGLVVHPDDSLLDTLSVESTDYLSYLIRMATNSDDFSARLPTNEYREVFTELESISTLWQLDPLEAKPEMLYCRLLAEVNEQGVPVQMANATDEKTRVLREVLPVVHGIGRYRRSHQSAFYKFVNMMPSLLLECIDTYSKKLDVATVDSLSDMLNDIIAFNTALKHNSDAANQFLSRFHHGHPLYTEMIQVLREQYTLMTTTGADLMRRFGMILKELGEALDGEPPIRSIDNFLRETRIEILYRKQQNITTEG